MSDTKALKITSGSVKRLQKELKYYTDELTALQSGLEGKEDYEHKKQLEMIDEGHMMVKDTATRLQAAEDKLKSLIQAAPDCDEKMTAASLVSK